MCSSDLFAVDSVVRRGQPFQGHTEVRLDGRWGSGAAFTADEELYVIRTAQPLGVLAVQLLDPQADDGLVTWNFFDAALGGTAGKAVFPVRRLTQPIAFATRIVP